VLLTNVTPVLAVMAIGALLELAVPAFAAARARGGPSCARRSP
jgi:hypothetical protein